MTTQEFASPAIDGARPTSTGGPALWNPDLFHILVDGVQDYAIFMVDANGVVITWNSGAERLWGYREDEILGQNFSCFYPPEEAAAGKPTRDLQRAKSAGRTQEESWRVRKDGSVFLADVVLTALRDNAGQLLGFAQIVRDITETRRAELAIRESEERFRLFMDNSPALNFIKDEEGRMVWIDQGWIERFGKATSDWIGKKDDDVWPPEVARELRRNDLAALQADQALETLEIFPSPEGESHWLTVRFAFRNSAGQRFVGGTLIDVTERHRAELEVRRLNAELEHRVEQRTAQLGAANEELKSFCYSVSHDLRTPLRAIDGFSQLLLEDYGDQLDDTARDYLGLVRAETQRMGHLIDDLLGLAQLSRAELARQEVDLSKMVHEIAGELACQYPSRDVDVTIPEELTARCDARLLRIVLENLLQNAWKFTSRQKLARIEFGTLPDRGSERIYYVRDNGAGFDMAHAEHLFGAFQRLHSTSEFAGTGVGLAIVQRVIHRHGGRVWAEAKVDGGATFFFTLGSESDGDEQAQQDQFNTSAARN